MPIMLWDKSLDIGVAPMNAEHQQILDVMNKIYDAREKGQHGATINLLVAQLGDVCVRHFSDEERYMDSIGFPGLSGHKHLHKQLLDRYGQHAAAIRAADGHPSDEFFQFLRFWLTSHIKGIDTKYAAHAHGAQHA